MIADESGFICQLLDNVSKRIGKPYKYLAQFQQALKKNWYDTPQALMKATDEEFDKMGIPLRVVVAIREELGIVQTRIKKEPQPTPEKQAPKQSKKQAKIEKPITETKNTEKAILSYCVKLENGLLEKYPWVGEQVKKILQTVEKVIKNILSDPYQIKFRVLKKTNAKIRQIFLSNEPVLNFMKDIGFEQTVQTLQLNKFQTHQLYFVADCLQEMSRNHAMQQDVANKNKEKSKSKENNNNRFTQNLCLPNNIQFPSNQNSTSLEGAFSKEQLEQANYADVLDKLIEYRNQIMAKPPTNRQIKIYHKKYEVRQTQFNQFDLQQEIEQGDNNVLARYWKNIIIASRNSTKFQSRRKNQFQFLIKQKIYRETVIKVSLPNQLIIQALFSPLETLRDVFTLVSDIVIGDIYLYQSPPVKRLDKELYQNLENMQAVPSGKFYLGINSQWYLKNQYVKIIRQ